jgi:hypothetical protein
MGNLMGDDPSFSQVLLTIYKAGGIIPGYGSLGGGVFLEFYLPSSGLSK